MYISRFWKKERKLWRSVLCANDSSNEMIMVQHKNDDSSVEK